MGWSQGTNSSGREVGYAVNAECDEPECGAKIHRGLDYCCGGMHDGGDYGCGDYFCHAHLGVRGAIIDGERVAVSLCARCAKEFEDKYPRTIAGIKKVIAEARKVVSSNEPDYHPYGYLCDLIENMIDEWGLDDEPQNDSLGG